MKYVRFLADKDIKFGILNNDETISSLNGDFLDNSTLDGGIYKLSEVKILTPTDPQTIVAIGLNYFDHVHEFGEQKVPENPTIFVKMKHTVIAQHEAIVYPEVSQRLDFEAEMALIIAKDCKNVSRNDANEYIFGVTCLNDVTARDIQQADGQWIRGKNYETFCPIGPCAATELNYDNLELTSRLNGNIMQRSNTKNMMFNTQILIEFVTSVIPLKKGDIIATGTPFGVAPMLPGDIIEIEIENVGILRNIIKK